MISKRLADSAVPMSLLADHPHVQFNFYRARYRDLRRRNALTSGLNRKASLPYEPPVFAIAAHPDDIEFVMAGTLMLLCAMPATRFIT